MSEPGAQRHWSRRRSELQDEFVTERRSGEDRRNEEDDGYYDVLMTRGDLFREQNYHTGMSFKDMLNRKWWSGKHPKRWASPEDVIAFAREQGVRAADVARFCIEATQKAVAPRRLAVGERRAEFLGEQ